MRKITLVDCLYAISFLLLLFPMFLSSLASVLVPSGAIRLALAAVGGGGIILLQLRRFKFYSLPYYCYIFLLAAVGIIFFGTLMASDRSINFVANAHYVLILTMFFFLYNDKRWLPVFLKLNFVFGVFYVLTTIWLYYDTNSFFTYFADHLYPNNLNYDFYNGYLHGFTSGVTNHYSTNGMMLANATIVFFSCAVVKKKNKKIALGSIVFLVLSLIALVMTGKRAHLLFTVSACVVAWMVYLSKDKNRAVKYAAFLLTALLVFVISVNVSSKLQNVLNRFVDVTEDGNVTSRFEFWDIALNSFSEHKLSGTGWLTFKDVSLTDQHTHNIYIQILAETGVVGAIVFYPFFLYSLCIGLRWLLAVCKCKEAYSRETLIFGVFSFCYQIYFLLYGITGNPLYDIYSYPLYFIAVFFSIASYNRLIGNQNISLPNRSAPNAIRRSDHC